MAEIDELIREVKSEVTRLGGETKAVAEQALAEVKSQGGIQAETRALVDQNMTSLTEVRGKLSDLSAQVLELEQRGPKAGDEKPKTFGEQVEVSAELAAFVANGARGTVKIPIRNDITSAGAGGLIRTDQQQEIVGIPRRRMRIRGLIPQGRTTSNKVDYPKMTTRTNNADVVTEGTEKPESNYVWGLGEANVRTIAHWVPITRQALEDAAQLRTEIDVELRYGLDMAEEEELLNGSGTGQHLSGLMTQATSYSAAFAPAMANLADKLRLAVLQLELADVEFDGAVLHPTDWARIELTKDSTGQYLFGNPLNRIGATLWGQPVVSTAAQDEDAFLVGAFAQAATIYDRMDAEVLFSSEDRDNFITNMITARAEKRLALAVKRPFALIKGDFGNVG